MLRLTTLGVKSAGPQPTWGQRSGEQLLDRAVDGGGVLVRGKAGWAITWRRMTRSLAQLFRVGAEQAGAR
jgi:hypothetical protein